LTLVLLLAFIFAFSADEIVVASIDGVREEEEQDDEGGVDDDNREDASEDEEGGMRDWVWGNGCGVVIPVIGVCSEGEDGDDVCGENDGWVIVEETGVKGREGAIKLEEEEIKGSASKYNNNNNKWKMENRKWEMGKKINLDFVCVRVWCWIHSHSHNHLVLIFSFTFFTSALTSCVCKPCANSLVIRSTFLCDFRNLKWDFLIWRWNGENNQYHKNWDMRREKGERRREKEERRKGNNHLWIWILIFFEIFIKNCSLLFSETTSFSSW